MTRLLHAHRDGNRDAFGQLVEIAYAELARIARRQLRKAPSGQTLDTVALVNEAYLRLIEQNPLDWQDRVHFYAVMARAMRFVVVEHARRHGAKKRGSELQAVNIDPERLAARDQQPEVILAVHTALERLESFNERLARVVECRYFAGMTEAEIAAALDTPLRTVQRDWPRALAWLRRELASPPAAST